MPLGTLLHRISASLYKPDAIVKRDRAAEDERGEFPEAEACHRGEPFVLFGGQDSPFFSHCQRGDHDGGLGVGRFLEFGVGSLDIGNTWHAVRTFAMPPPAPAAGVCQKLLEIDSK